MRPPPSAAHDLPRTPRAAPAAPACTTMKSRPAATAAATPASLASAPPLAPGAALRAARATLHGSSPPGRRSRSSASFGRRVTPTIDRDAARRRGPSPRSGTGADRPSPRERSPASAPSNTCPALPSTVTSLPARASPTPSPQPTTQGTPRERLTTAAWEVVPPVSVTTARAATMPCTSSGLVVGRTSTTSSPAAPRASAVSASRHRPRRCRCRGSRLRPPRAGRGLSGAVVEARHEQRTHLRPH